MNINDRDWVVTQSLFFRRALTTADPRFYGHYAICAPFLLTLVKVYLNF